MKVHDVKQATPAGARPAQPFRQLLAEARRPAPNGEVGAKAKGAAPAPVASRGAPPKAPAVASPAARTSATSVSLAQAEAGKAQQTRTLARQRVDGEAERLSTVRGLHHEAATQREVRAVESTSATAERVDGRVLSLIVKELQAAFEGDPPPAERAANCDGKTVSPLRSEGLNAAPQPAKVEPPARAEQAVALIERIETFVRSSRPALALTLNNSLGARVEIERLGKGQIALKLVGHHGPPSASTVAAIREELRARGLRVGALSVA